VVAQDLRPCAAPLIRHITAEGRQKEDFMAIDMALSLAAIAVAYNIVVFGVYGLDKHAARNGEWRVKESTLLTLACLGGGPGALAAQRLLRHKTRKPPFAVALPLIFILQMALLVVAIAAPEAIPNLLRKFLQA